VLEFSSVIDENQLAATIDLWRCMWQPEERERFETAIVLTLTDAHPHATRLGALAAAHVIATPRLCNAAAKIAETQVFRRDEIRWVEEHTLPYYRLLIEAEKLRDNLGIVEALLQRYLNGLDRRSDEMLDWIDVRDLVAVARTTLDARLYAEVERRIARRGHYQRGRVANLLGFVVRSDQGLQAPPAPRLRAAG
jgi:hypothetical protein